MRKIFIPLFALVFFSVNLVGQTPRDIKTEAIPVYMFQATYAFHFPALDNKSLYGISNNIGGSFVFKSENNLLLTFNANYIFGPKVKSDRPGYDDRIGILGEGITTNDGEITGSSGSFASLAFNQRGFHAQGEVGYLFPLGPNPNSGLFVQAGLGYLVNRIRIDFETNLYNTPFVVYEDYQYGYDRMRGGLAGHFETGYLYVGETRVLNFSVSLEVTYARTRELRDYDFRVFDGVPVGFTDPNKRYNDMYYGIRVCWNIPTYQRQPDEYYYN